MHNWLSNQSFHIFTYELLKRLPCFPPFKKEVGMDYIYKCKEASLLRIQEL